MLLKRGGKLIKTNEDKWEIMTCRRKFGAIYHFGL